MNNIYLKTFSNKSWELYNGDSLELCSSSYKEYLAAFKDISKDLDFKVPSNILIVGGGDKQIFNHLKAHVHQDSTITIVDPLVGEFDTYTHLYTEVYAKRIFKNERFISSLFSEAFPILKEEDAFDYIVVDCSEEIVESTSEIYCSEFVDQLHSLVKPEGVVYHYVPPAINVQVSPFSEAIHAKFDPSYVAHYITAWAEACSFLKLKPLKLLEDLVPPTLKDHVHFHCDFIFNPEGETYLDKDNESYVTKTFEEIVSKYCTIMKVASHQFDYGGYSGSFILGESHFNWHSYPEINLLTVDLYHCRFDESLYGVFEDIILAFLEGNIKTAALTTSVFDPLNIVETRRTNFQTLEC